MEPRFGDETGDKAQIIDSMMRDNFDDIWRYARRRCSSADDADDIVAEVFAAAYRRSLEDELPPPDERRVWLYGVGRKVLANQRRSAARRDRLHVRLSEEPTPPVDEVDAADDSLWRALKALPDEDCDLLIMRAWEQIPVADIAVILDCTPNAVSLRLHKARRRLNDILVKTGQPGRGDDGAQTDSAKAGHVAVIPPTKEDRNG